MKRTHCGGYFGFEVISYLSETGVIWEFSCYEVTGKTVDDVPVFECREGWSDDTDISGAIPIIMGSIKWDGCANMHFFPKDNGYAHTCGVEGLSGIGDLLKSLHGIASEAFAEAEQYCLFTEDLP